MVAVGMFAIAVAIIELFIPQFNLATAWIILPVVLMLLFISYQLTQLTEVNNKIGMFVDDHGYNKVEVYNNYPDFYKSLAGGLDEAENSVYLTHVRDQTPEEFNADEANEWFQKIKDWAEDNPGTPIRRVTSMNTENMVSWGRELKRQTNEVSNFNINVVDWDHGFQMVNFVVYDEKELYVTLTSDTAEETKGAKIVDEELARAYADYFNSLWNFSKPLDEVIEDDIDLELTEDETMDLKDPN